MTRRTSNYVVMFQAWGFSPQQAMGNQYWEYHRAFRERKASQFRRKRMTRKSIDGKIIAAIYEETLRDARPRQGFRVRCSVNYLEYTREDIDVSGNIWTQQFIEEGFDPAGPCGPTYWRIPADTKHYYSTILHPKLGVPFLVITSALEAGCPLPGRSQRTTEKSDVYRGLPLSRQPGTSPRSEADGGSTAPKAVGLPWATTLSPERRDDRKGHRATLNLWTMYHHHDPEEHVIMDDHALMTVEITVVGENKTIAIGGPMDQAIAMQSRLARQMNLPISQANTLLSLTLEAKDLETLVMPILAEFPDLGWSFTDEVPQPVIVTIPRIH
jgi:hypothetical protein